MCSSTVNLLVQPDTPQDPWVSVFVMFAKIFILGQIADKGSTMTTAQATFNRYSSKTTRRRRYRSHRPLLAQKFSVASKALSSLRNDTETKSLNTIDFYSDGASSDRRMVGPISREEPEGRLFNKAGDPVILAPGQQHRPTESQRRVHGRCLFHLARRGRAL